MCEFWLSIWKAERLHAAAAKAEKVATLQNEQKLEMKKQVVASLKVQAISSLNDNLEVRCTLSADLLPVLFTSPTIDAN